MARTDELSDGRCGGCDSRRCGGECTPRDIAAEDLVDSKWADFDDALRGIGALPEVDPDPDSYHAEKEWDRECEDRLIDRMARGGK
jgi:hypothetical protein